ncbi:hypothetical protein, partial [Pandoraea pneumonica]|uniref:hypothetical protein n=1 Tax=Pandoraea pneumonica TaxID=2508299 RepID=UPI003CEA7476
FCGVLFVLVGVLFLFCGGVVVVVFFFFFFVGLVNLGGGVFLGGFFFIATGGCFGFFFFFFFVLFGVGDSLPWAGGGCLEALTISLYLFSPPRRPPRPP